MPSNLAPNFWQSIRKTIVNQKQTPPIEAISHRENIQIPLSYNQEQLWQLDSLNIDSVYNITNVLRFTLELNFPALEKSLREIVRRHAILRTKFPLIDGKPVQNIISETKFRLPLLDLREFSGSEKEAKAQEVAIAERQTTFDLTKEPGLRVQLLHLADTDFILILTMHHIIFDGASFGILFKELQILYEAFSDNKLNPLSEPIFQYADFAYWQRKLLANPSENYLFKYWQKKLQGEIESLQLPQDKSINAAFQYQGKFKTFQLSLPLTKKIEAFSEKQGVTLFSTLLTAFKTLLYCYTKQKDIILVSPVEGRDRPETKKLIGYFNNLLLLRDNLDNNPTFLQLLNRVNSTFLEAREHQDFPFEKFTDFPNLARISLSRCMFAFSNYQTQAPQLSDNSSNPIKIKNISQEKSNFDFSLSMSNRVDKNGHQVEIRGFRFNLSEIEMALERHPNIEESLVLVREEKPQEKFLVAYVVTTQQKVPEIEELRSFLKQKLPIYMIPSSLVPLETMPLTANGEVDRVALAEINLTRQTLEQNYVAPRNPTEKKLAEIWTKVLWLDQEVGIHDNFFDLGGHSLLSVRLIAEIEQAFNREIPLAALFPLATIAELAMVFEQEMMNTPETIISSSTASEESKLAPEIYHQLLAYTAGWRGTRVNPNSLIVGMNTSGKAQPIFWCLQGFRELYQLAKYLGEERPVYGMRSGHLFMEYTRENIRALAAHYVSEILSLDSEGPYLLGGNCQSVFISFEIAQQLQRKGKKITLLCLLENFVPQTYAGRVAFFFCRDSYKNPYKYFSKPELGWRKFYGGEISLDILGCAYPKYFHEPAIQVFAKKLNSYINQASATVQLLPKEAYQAEISAQESLVARAGESVSIPVTVKNISSVLWQASSISGIALGNHWQNEQAEIIQWLDGRVEFDQDLAPNAEITLSLTISAPMEVGNYYLELDLLEEGLTWFEKKGSKTCKVQVEVAAFSGPSQPENIDLYLRQGNSQLEKGDTERAILSYQKALALNPKEPGELYQNLGAALARQKNWLEAIAAYTVALKLQPNNPHLQYILGQAQAEQNDFSAAIASYRKVIELDPEYFAIYSQLGHALGEIKDFSNAIAAYEKAITMKSDDWELYKNLANFQLQNKEFDLAILNCHKALEFYPENFSIFRLLGDIYFQAHNYTDAIANYETAIKLSPNNYTCYTKLGHLFVQQDNLDQALNLYHKAQKLQSQNENIYRVLGNIYGKQQNMKSAKVNYQQALKLDPKNAQSHLKMGNLLEQENQLDSAIIHYQAVVNLQPDIPYYYYLLGNTLLNSNKIEDATKAFVNALKIDPNYASAYNKLAKIQCQQGDLAAAIKSYQRSLELNPNRSNIYRLLGDVQLKSGDSQSAISNYQKAVELNSKQPFSVYKNLGDALTQKGEIEKAIASYRQALELKPNNKAVSQSLETVKRSISSATH